MITHYLKIAWRNLWKYKVQSVISMAGLAVCVLCFSICLYICRLMWATDRCFPKKERIAEVVLNGPHGDFSGIPLDLLDKLRGMHSPAIEAFTYVAYPGNRSYEIEVKPDEMLPTHVSARCSGWKSWPAPGKQPRGHPMPSSCRKARRGASTGNTMPKPSANG